MTPSGCLIAVSLLVAVLLYPVNALAGEFVLAERGRPADCLISIDPDSKGLVHRAADELRAYTRKMTGVDLRIVTNAVAATDKAVVIKCNDTYSLLDGDAFGIKAKPNRLVITGGRRGVLYGVYELLERFGGCDWFAPWCEKVPARDSFAVPSDIDFADAPAFVYRSTNWRHTRKTRENVAFAAKMRFNGIAQDDKLGRELCGGASVRFAPGLYADNAFNSLIPAKECFAEHPDWFSEVGGKRIAERTQLCWSNEEMREFFVKRVKDRIRKAKETAPDDGAALIASIAQNDWPNWCQCEKCAAVTKEEGSPAGPNIRFANAVAEEVEKEFPDVFIATHAYQFTRHAPKHAKPRHNVIVQLCPFECSFARPFDEAKDPRTKSFCDDLLAWGSMGERLSIREYSTDFTYYLYPFPNIFSMAPNFRLYKANNAWMVNSQGDGNGYHGDMSELKCYLQSKLMWNPNQPIDPLIDRFMAGYYGGAAPIVRQYLAELYAAMGLPAREGAQPELDHVWGGIYTQTIPQLTDSALGRLGKRLDEAESAVKDDPASLYNVHMAKLPIIMVRLARLYGDNFRRVWVAEDIAPHIAGMESTRTVAAELLSRIAEMEREKRCVQLSEDWSRHCRLLQDFCRLQTWQAPTSGCTRAVATAPTGPKDYSSAIRRIVSEHAWHLPVREIACDEGVKCRVRAHLRPVEATTARAGFMAGGGFAYGVRVEWRTRQPSGTVRKTVAKKDVKPDWAWYDLGEYDISALQKHPRPTLDWLCLFVQGDVEVDQMEIERLTKKGNIQ